MVFIGFISPAKLCGKIGVYMSFSGSEVHIGKVLHVTYGRSQEPRCRWSVPKSLSYFLPALVFFHLSKLWNDYCRLCLRDGFINRAVPDNRRRICCKEPRGLKDPRAQAFLQERPLRPLRPSGSPAFSFSSLLLCLYVTAPCMCSFTGFSRNRVHF